jgi:integrase
MSLKYPKVSKKSDGRYYVDLTLKNKRYRLFSGVKISSSLNPNSYPAPLRKPKAKELAKEIYDYLTRNDYSFEPKKSSIQLFDELVAKKLSEPLSKKYKTELRRLSNLIRPDVITHKKVRSAATDKILLKYSNSTSYNTHRRHLNAILQHLEDNSFPVRLKARKQEEVLHKPIVDIATLFEALRLYKQNLYLCCLLAYGCLLRPHREIRLLTWGDFSEDLSFIHLSGSRVKNKRNRIVPVPSYVRKELKRREPHLNIFTNKVKPFNESYFSNVWRRFKRIHPIKEGVTLYSFRHTAAIDVYTRTGSLSKLQKAMGHSNLNVSLTYLRGLDVAELKEEDMPVLMSKNKII